MIFSQKLSLFMKRQQWEYEIDRNIQFWHWRVFDIFRIEQFNKVLKCTR